MSTTDERSRVEYVTDPAAAMSRLASADRFGEYVMYERPGQWVFAADPIGSIELDASELRVTWEGETTVSRWEGSPARALDRALGMLPAGSAKAYGWIGFEFCAWALAATDHVDERTSLAHLMIPRIEVVVDESGVRVGGATPSETADIHDLIAAAQDTDLPQPHPIDVRIDPTGYRDRVAEAVAEIGAGRYQKVILSRKVDLPFTVDVPATYRLGRANNTPARSFLLRLGGLESAGFSPELVASVDEDRVVTTEPLAGTRAFGRGHEVDMAARADLVSDPKEIVEHAISVQTSFAEISAVADPGTPAVSDFMAVRERGSVQHLASTVRGRLAADRSSWDALEVLFPSVTASGIPKREGVDSVFRLDGAPRGLYSGAVVTVSPTTGALEATLVLRAVYQTAEGAWLRAGAGVVGQSRPEREFEETCEKLGSIAPYVVKA
ncbi:MULTISPECIES: nocobactin biosynthesis salicylate synthase NbtS [Nocardia]|uniref:nocobactin biosynthesis salicylate synthase NbtS n=1 Tax=Nocardia TaxID=1817 RepID=UPI000BEFAB7F|nr:MULTISPECIES: nocobactin biosynthesis salicylate synthase NbtS [Nocardia]MBF6187119.1 nocobactin biosynthesis salicylate synthase NbtS [Nocardia farcinica]MBF6270022.1 nocobactin biosynthesis salicylate synthase NbtS [Nocardia farcinica]MBF6312767.1 nocobactin biosynthesis salicylate synthase NbtS [Nocardia farcinica]MBF6408378.1 nocobactin biosynthesis salicylate synthase NbtS [Nocardia farcinica]PEH78848.1 salicylate synthase [Nocardia sp. FDAARGOS_372]